MRVVTRGLPNKTSLFLEEVGLPYEVVSVETSNGEQHLKLSAADAAPPRAPANDRGLRRDFADPPGKQPARCAYD
jgi:hypothetical protein